MVIALILDIIISGFSLWVAGKLTALHITFKDAVIAVVFSALVALVPAVGWLLSIVVFFYLLQRFSDGNIWPDIVLTALVSKLIYLITVFFIVPTVF